MKKTGIVWIEAVVAARVQCPYCNEEEYIDFDYREDYPDVTEEWTCNNCGKVFGFDTEDWTNE